MLNFALAQFRAKRQSNTAIILRELNFYEFFPSHRSRAISHPPTIQQAIRHGMANESPDSFTKDVEFWRILRITHSQIRQSELHMRILVLTKRQYMGRDLLDDRFGRFRELPLELARLGHEVRGISLSYRPRPEGSIIDSAPCQDGHVVWHSLNLINGFVPALKSYFKHVRHLLQDFRPDVIWACSDAYHAIFGYRLSRQYQARCVIDLYDNFEAFGATKLPAVLPLFKRAVRGADGVTCFSRRLVERIVQNYSRVKPTEVIESGVNTELFFPQDRLLCRQLLGLPEDATLIGMAGALHSSRDVHSLFRAFEILAAENHRLNLVLAGARERGLRIPKGPRVHDLKTLPHDRVPVLINSLNLTVIGYRDSVQGRYSFPQKAYEILACRAPLIAASVGTMQDLLKEQPGCLFQPGHPESLAAAARSQLKSPVALDIPVPTWGALAKQLEAFFALICNGNPAAS
jgi:teichuronic acid biosynthesis glycosyltransferase TuaC